MATDITAITATGTSPRAVRAEQFHGVFNVLLAKVTLEDDSLAAQKASQVDVTLPGVRFGDFVMVSNGVDLAGLIVDAHVQAADVVTITLYNVEGEDANTSMATPVEVNILVLQPKSGGPYTSL